MNGYDVAEKFISINGEGPKAGELALFIRFKGCNLNCSYCDTKWANSLDCKSERYTQAQLLDYVRESGIKNVTLTGGEPLLVEGIYSLIEALINDGRSVEIETNGSVPIADFICGSVRPAFTLDYKLPSSGMEGFMLLENYSHIERCDTVKFVAGDDNDLNRALEIITEYGLCERCHVYLSPVFGSIDPKRMVEFMKEHRLNDVRLQLQLHKFIWPPDAKGV